MKRQTAAAVKKELATFARRFKRRTLREKIAAKRAETKAGRVACRADKQAAKEQAARLRERRLELVAACRTASTEGREAVRRAREALAVFRQSERERIESERKRPALRRTSREAREESDSEVARNLPPELEYVWRRVKRLIHPGPRRSRTEAFLEWVEENPDEVAQLEAENVEADVERMIGEYVIEWS